MAASTPPFAGHCGHCGRLVAAPVRGAYTAPDSDGEISTRYDLAECPECQQPILIRQHSLDRDDCDPYDPQVLYPIARRLDASVPEAIAKSFDGALRCFECNLFTPCAIMCRRTLEGICVQQGASGRNLRDKIEWLKTQSVIDTQMYDWANELRFAGNDAAHDVGVDFTQKDARDLVDFTRVLAEHIFTFTAAFQEFKKRRGSSRGGQSP